MATTNTNVGLAFPFQLENGRVAMVGGTASAVPTVGEADASVQAGAKMTIRTGRGERVMFCGYGVGANRYLFSPMGMHMSGMLAHDTREQLDLYSPRSRVTAVAGKVIPERGQVVVMVRLAHARSGDESVVKEAVSG